jgi:hypothetical protein
VSGQSCGQTARTTLGIAGSLAGSGAAWGLRRVREPCRAQLLVDVPDLGERLVREAASLLGLNQGDMMGTLDVGDLLLDLGESVPKFLRMC